MLAAAAAAATFQTLHILLLLKETIHHDRRHARQQVNGHRLRWDMRDGNNAVRVGVSCSHKSTVTAGMIERPVENSYIITPTELDRWET